MTPWYQSSTINKIAVAQWNWTRSIVLANIVVFKPLQLHGQPRRNFHSWLSSMNGEAGTRGQEKWQDLLEFDHVEL